MKGLAWVAERASGVVGFIRTSDAVEDCCDCLKYSHKDCWLDDGGGISDRIARSLSCGVGGNDPPFEEAERDRWVGGVGEPESALNDGVSPSSSKWNMPACSH